MIGKASTGHLARRAASTALLSGLLAVAVAAMIQLLLDTRAMRLHPPPGEVLRSGHFALHVHERGVRGRGPAVILDAGGGSFSAQWGWIAPALAEHAHVVAYDRPGLGAARLTNPARGMVGTLPMQVAAQGLAMFVSTSHLSAMANEWPMSNRTVDRLAAVGENLGDLPNIVLSAGEPDEYFHGERRIRFTETQRALASLSTRGEHRVVEGADHYTIVTNRGHAASVTTAVLDVLALLRRESAAEAAFAGPARPLDPGLALPDLAGR